MKDIIRTLPDGKLLCCKNGEYYKWYISQEGKIVFLPKSQRKLAEELAYKNYCVKKENAIEQEINALKQCCDTLYEIEIGLDAMLDENAEQRRLLNDYLLDYDEMPVDWVEEYECSTNYPEHLIHKTLKGHMVRSKSEVIIANALYLNKIPYKYECGLYLDGTQFFPDFTVYHVGKKQELYWEHFGMMDVSPYCEKAYSKLRTYGNHGIIPTINLIATFETQDHPIDSGRIQQIIEEYLL